jgi:hypothetical protein
MVKANKNASNEIAEKKMPGEKYRDQTLHQA